MKVFAALVLVVSSAAALGSGPYLPSGWKPEGPAFYLPSEHKPSPPIDIILQGSEGSSSDFLREYGPPQAEVKIQSLPEVSTEQPFVVLSAKLEEEQIVETATEVANEEKASVESEVVEEAENSEQATEKAEEVIQGKSLNLEVESSVVEGAVESDAVLSIEEEVSAASAAKIESEVQEEAQTIVEGVNNIAEAIINLEKEVVAQEVQISQDVTELRSGQQNSESSTVPEGFLEYGPPGFREYGPPKQNSLLRTAEDKTETEKIENNETRRRRFSPKFRSHKKH
ncbi:hypothetical protein ACJJTC_000260 [Scirpophaga incertulas]